MYIIMILKIYLYAIFAFLKRIYLLYAMHRVVAAATSQPTQVPTHVSTGVVTVRDTPAINFPQKNSRCSLLSFSWINSDALKSWCTNTLATPGGLLCDPHTGTGIPPASVAEWTLGGDGNRDFYDSELPVLVRAARVTRCEVTWGGAVFWMLDLDLDLDLEWCLKLELGISLKIWAAADTYIVV